MSTLITSIDRRSPAERAGVRPGERLLSINSRAVEDVLDYRFFGYDESTGTWTFGPTSEEFRELVTFYHRLYEEELLLPNFLTIDTKGWQDVMANSDSFITIDYLSRIDFFNNAMRESEPDFTMAYMAPPSFGENGVNKFAFSAKGVYGFVVSSRTKQLDKVLAYVD